MWLSTPSLAPWLLGRRCRNRWNFRSNHRNPLSGHFQGQVGRHSQRAAAIVISGFPSGAPVRGRATVPPVPDQWCRLTPTPLEAAKSDCAPAGTGCPGPKVPRAPQTTPTMTTITKQPTHKVGFSTPADQHEPTALTGPPWVLGSAQGCGRTVGRVYLGLPGVGLGEDGAGHDVVETGGFLDG